MRNNSYGQSGQSILDKIIASVRIIKIKPLIKRDSALLDLGCGYYGELLGLLEDQISQGVGIDLSVGTSKKNRLIKGSVDEVFAIESERFDVVTALALIEHVDKPEKMLSEAHRVLKHDGTMLITTPSKSGKLPLEIMAQLGIISKTEIDDHKRYYTKKSLEKEMELAGFKSIKVRYFGIMWMNLLGVGVK